MNHFNDGDLVECIQVHPGYKYQLGKWYVVRNSGGMATHTFVPCPSGNSGLTCDGPWALQHFRLAQATVQVLTGGLNVIGSNLPTPVPLPGAHGVVPNVGDFVRLNAIDGTLLSPQDIGKDFEVVKVHTYGGLFSAKPYIDIYVPNIGTQWIRDDQYDYSPPKLAGLLTAIGAGQSPYTVPKLQPRVVYYAAGANEWVTQPPKLEEHHGPRCECGAESVGHPRHSDWCQMYRKGA